MLTPSDTSVPSPDSNKVKILVLSHDNEETKGVQSHLMKMRLPEGAQCEIDHKNEAADLTKTAEMINQGNYDLVLIGEDVASSAWKMIKICSETKALGQQPIFYLAGKAETVLDREIKQTHFSGSVIIAKEGKPLLRAGFRESNRQSHEKNTPETKLNIASIVKILTATDIVKIVEERLKEKYKGKDIYKMPIRELLPEKLPENFPNPEIFRNFSLHELLTHTSGLTDPVLFESYYGGKEVLFTDIKDFISRISSLYQTQDLNSRGKQRYCNYGFFLVGLAIEAISGKNYYDSIRENILIPAKMNQTQPRKLCTESTALPNITQPTVSISFKPAWLIKMADYDPDAITKTEAESEADRKLNLIVLNVLNLFEAVQKSVALTYPIVQALLMSYQKKLSELDGEDEKGYAAVRAEFAGKLDQAYALMGTRDEKGIFQFKYAELAKKLEETYHILMEWCKSNTNQSNKFENLQSVKDVEKLKFLLGPEGLYKNLFWPMQVVGGIQIDMSIAHPAGCWISTVDDLLKLNEALWSKDGALNQYAKKLIASEEAKEFGYGYGMIVSKGPGAEMGHTGGAPGMCTNCFTYPNQGITVITLANDDGPEQQIRPVIEHNLVLGSVKYLDSSITLKPDNTLLEDIVAIHNNKNNAATIRP